jgi:hypothetical protein
MQDYIAMVIIWYATQQNEQGGSATFQQYLQENLTRLESHLDKALEK